MALHFSGEVANQQPKTFEPISAGKYEVILNTEWKKSKSGNMYINCIFRIRKGQNFENRVVFDGIYKSKTTGEYSEQKINAILSAIPNAKRDFEDYDDLIQYLNDKPMIIEVDIELPDPEYPNSKEKNIVVYLSYEPSKLANEENNEEKVETTSKAQEIFGKDLYVQGEEEYDLAF